jgi:excisionase family DNA binding protein
MGNKKIDTENNSQPLILNRIGKLKQLLTVKELANRYRVSSKTIYKWVDRKIIEPEPAGPKLIRFDLEKVEQRLLIQKEQL